MLLSIAERAGLVGLAPLDGGSNRRELYVTKEIDQLINARERSAFFPSRFADEVIGRHLRGECLWVCLSEQPDPAADVDFKRLVETEEMWTLRFARRRLRINGWRVFGGFLAQDFFIGLVAIARDELKTKVDWDGTIEKTRQKWRELFPTAPPITGSSVSMYLSEPCQDVTKIDD